MNTSKTPLPPLIFDGPLDPGSLHSIPENSPPPAFVSHRHDGRATIQLHRCILHIHALLQKALPIHVRLTRSQERSEGSKPGVAWKQQNRASNTDQCAERDQIVVHVVVVIVAARVSRRGIGNLLLWV